ncbi:hypothetical protein [Chondromyces apiculatus]|uniref:Glycosyl transferase family 28 C-terminal domain-containing protein n=1 Tax=Chondromyces apiculatus DSM 436 TaxID=1192034 RepID=A0A017THH8_9BACT|nr:hypothetical protein [Chondromyces apiculatus]EYF08704.1 Hypothetical protein CAP_2565 [Chondromyces apiculatus DSM 436]
MKKVLMVADPFGFGGVGSLMSCRELLSPLDLTFRFLIPAFARDLVDAAHREHCTFYEGKRAPIEAHLPWCDILWSATESHSIHEAAKAGKRVIFYDPIFWFWATVSPFHVPDMLYLCQNFPGVPERVQALPPAIRSTLRVVAPRTFPRPAKRPSDAPPHLLVNLCGLHNPVRILHGYTELVTSCLLDALADTRWARVTIAGWRPELAHIERRDPRVVCRPLSHEEMIQGMSTADLLLSSPGLNSAMEAMALGTPVVFLPSQNASQARQLRTFVAHGLTPTATDWDTLADTPTRWEDLDDPQAMDRFAQLLETCAASPERVDALRKVLSELVRLDPPALASVADKQAEFFASLSRGHGSLAEVLAAEGIG